jgi:hypothetical protein
VPKVSRHVGGSWLGTTFEETRVSDRPGEMDERDVDERFASIVAAWNSPSSPEAPLPDDEPEVGEPEVGTTGEAPADQGAEPAPDADTDVDPDGGPPTDAEDPSAPPETGGRPPWVNPSPLDVGVPAASWRGAPPPTGAGPTAAGPAEPPDDEHYEPPPVTLPPQEDLHFWGAVVGLVAGPLLLLYVAMARPFHSDRWFAAGVVLSLVGFGLLVLRQPRHRDPSDGDDGARV